MQFYFYQHLLFKNTIVIRLLTRWRTGSERNWRRRKHNSRCTQHLWYCNIFHYFQFNIIGLNGLSLTRQRSQSARQFPGKQKPRYPRPLWYYIETLFFIRTHHHFTNDGCISFTRQRSRFARQWTEMHLARWSRPLWYCIRTHRLFAQPLTIEY